MREISNSDYEALKRALPALREAMRRETDLRRYNALRVCVRTLKKWS